jgi:hypothetical protein
MKVTEKGNKVQAGRRKPGVDPNLDKYSEKDYSPHKTAMAEKHAAAAIEFLKQRKSAKG